jgi:hypothetical protein
LIAGSTSFFIFASVHANTSPVLLSTAYAPPISWIMEVIKAPQIYIEAFETYPRQTYRNRCRIVTANGVLALSIPVQKVHGKQTITKDIRINYREPWQRNHRRTIDAAYSNSPFYLYYIDELMPFYEKTFKYLLDFNLELTNQLIELLGFNATLNLTKAYIHQPNNILDLRHAFSPKNKAPIQKSTPYFQVFEERHGFIADLSILDLLFNEGPGAGSYLNKE